MSADEARAAAVRHWWSAAQESLASAARELEAEAYTFAVNRLYYAAFYAVSAILLERDLTFKKHSGVRAAFHRDFIRTGSLELDWGKHYDRLFEDRQEGDYLGLTTFEHEYVAHQLARSREFLEQIRPLIASLRDE